MNVEDQFNVPAAADCKIGRPCSSLRFAIPTEQGTNHLLGHCLGGQRHAQRCGPTPSSTSFTAKFYTYRHPNADWMDFALELGSDFPVGEVTSGQINISVGSGTTQTLSLAWSTADHQWVRARAPWGAADSAYQEVTVKTFNIALRSLMAWDTPRVTLSTGDHRIDHLDASHTAIGLMVDKAIASSATAGPTGIVAEIANAWNDYHPQVMSWWTYSSVPLGVNTSTLEDFFSNYSGAKFTHRARAKTSTTSTTDTRWYLYSWCDAGTTYELTVSTTGDSGSVSSLTNTSPAWQAAITGVACKNNADDTITISGHRTAGAGKVYLCAASGLEE